MAHRFYMQLMTSLNLFTGRLSKLANLKKILHRRLSLNSTAYDRTTYAASYEVMDSEAKSVVIEYFPRTCEGSGRKELNDSNEDIVPDSLHLSFSWLRSAKHFNCLDVIFRLNSELIVTTPKGCSVPVIVSSWIWSVGVAESRLTCNTLLGLWIKVWKKGEETFAPDNITLLT